MRALVVANSDDDDAGYVGERLVERGYELVARLPRRARCAPVEPGRVDLFVMLGSDWSTYWEHVRDEVERESALGPRGRRTGPSDAGDLLRRSADGACPGRLGPAGGAAPRSAGSRSTPPTTCWRRPVRGSSSTSTRSHRRRAPRCWRRPGRSAGIPDRSNAGVAVPPGGDTRDRAPLGSRVPRPGQPGRSRPRAGLRPDRRGVHPAPTSPTTALPSPANEPTPRRRLPRHLHPLPGARAPSFASIEAILPRLSNRVRPNSGSRSLDRAERGGPCAGGG